MIDDLDICVCGHPAGVHRNLDGPCLADDEYDEDCDCDYFLGV